MSEASITYLKNHETEARLDMAQPKPIRHGGNLAAATQHFGEPEGGTWLDLSTGINACSYPLPAMPGAVAQRLPDGGDFENLLSIARTYYGVPQDAHIVAAPGSQALIQAVPNLYAPASVAILGPTYAEHAPSWAACGHRVEDAPSSCALSVTGAAAGTDYAVVVNPNNPDGRIQPPDALVAFGDELFERGGALIIDEAFCDVSPKSSTVAYSGKPGLVVLKSFGKFFGLAGMRLGFAICDRDTAARLKKRLGPWAVSGPAIWAATLAMNDQAWIANTRARLKRDAARMDALLLGAGFEIVGGTHLFRLGAHAQARDIYAALGAKGILTRPFDENASWLRFGLPGDEGAWQRLQAALNR